MSIWVAGNTNLFAADYYAKFFQEADADDDGFISFTDFKLICTKYRYSISESHLWFCFTQPITGDNYNRLSFHDFMTAMGLKRQDRASSVKRTESKAPAEGLRDSFLRHIFKMFDKDGNGEIDRYELKEVFSELGRPMTDAQVRKIISAADTNGSMSLSYDEFADVLTKEGMASGNK